MSLSVDLFLLTTTVGVGLVCTGQCHFGKLSEGQIYSAFTNTGVSQTMNKFSNSRDNIEILYHTRWRYIFTNETLTQLFFSCIL